MNEKDSLNSIYFYLKTLNIDIDLDEFKYQLETHPDYPSLLTYSDTLNFFKVDNDAFKINVDQIHLLPNDFVAVFKAGEGVVLRYVKFFKNKIYLNNKIVNKEDFIRDFNQVVLLVENELEFKNKSLLSKLFFKTISIFIIALLFVFLYLIQIPTIYLLLTFTSFLGFVISVETFRQTLDNDSGIISKLCNFSKYTSCKSVVGSKKWSVFKYFNLTDISILFFGIEIFSLVFFAIFKTAFFPIYLLYWSVFFTFPIGLISIFYQWKVEKRWCPLCLLIIGVLWSQAIMIYVFFDFNIYYSKFSEIEVVLFVLIVLFVTNVWFLLKNHFLKWSEILKENKKNLRFKKNYNIFKDLLKKEKQLFPPINNKSILIGNKNAKHSITVLTSPFCGHCYEVHSIIERLLKKYDEEILIHINFSMEKGEGEYSLRNYLIYKKLHTIFINEGFNEFSRVINLFFNKKINVVDFIIDFPDEENELDDIIRKQTAYFTSEGITFTPLILVNHFVLPQFYERKEIENFIIDLIEEDKWE